MLFCFILGEPIEKLFEGNYIALTAPAVCVLANRAKLLYNYVNIMLTEMNTV